MIVRCGRCRIELEVSGPGEFVCPSCGTRNTVRSSTVGGDLLDLSAVRSEAGPSEQNPPPGVRWVSCPGCSYRFAIGERERVACPNCSADLEVTPEGLKAAP